MQMVMIVFRSSLESDVLTVLRTSGVRAYTDVRRVVGIGEEGARLDSFEQPGFNSLIVTALDDSEASALVERLRTFRDEASQRRRGGGVPLRTFVLPCSQAL
jgi:nitrogen regulatory protein PII